MSTERPGWQGDRLEIRGTIYTIELCPDFQQFDEAERRKLAIELTPLTGRGFMRLDLQSKELKDDVYDHVAPAPRLLIVRDKKKEPVAYIASALIKLVGIRFYLLGGIMIDENLHHSGLGYKILAGELLTTGSEAVVFRTQSKKMLGLAKKVANLDENQTLAVAPIVYPKNLEGTVCRRCYLGGRSLYEDEERFAPQAIDWIDWRHGDGLVVAGLIRSDLT